MWPFLCPSLSVVPRSFPLSFSGVPRPSRPSKSPDDSGSASLGQGPRTSSSSFFFFLIQVHGMIGDLKAAIWAELGNHVIIH